MKSTNKFATAILMGMTTMTMGIVLESNPAHAVSFTGSLANADAIATNTFTTSGTALNFQSFSYAAGGFSPVLTIFDPSSNYFNEYISAGDLNFTATLPTGSYQAVISTFGRYFDFPTKTNLAQGFDGSGDFFGRNSTYTFDITSTAATAVPEPSDLIGTVVAGFSVVMFKRKLSSGKQQK